MVISLALLDAGLIITVTPGRVEDGIGILLLHSCTDASVLLTVNGASMHRASVGRWLAFSLASQLGWIFGPVGCPVVWISSKELGCASVLHTVLY